VARAESARRETIEKQVFTGLNGMIVDNYEKFLGQILNIMENGDLRPQKIG
jgi:hypothetical protein